MSETNGYNPMTDSGEGIQWDTRTCVLVRSALELVTMTNWLDPLQGRHRASRPLPKDMSRLSRGRRPR